MLGVKRQCADCCDGPPFAKLVAVSVLNLARGE
jgi:hypothetical protein